MPAPISVIVIQLDSLNRHFLPPYGNPWVRAPNLTAFAERATVFEQHFAGSLPCMPARREIWTGSEEFWWRPWGPLEPWDFPVAHLCSRQDIPCQLVTDHYHFFEWGAHGYIEDFRGYSFIRGHEYDNFRTRPVETVPDWAEVMLKRHPASMIYLRNVQGFSDEADFFAPRVMAEAAEWLDANRTQKRFYLHVDSFDVHEPFHVPEPYRSMYTDDDYRHYSPWPTYGRSDALSGDELAWVRAQFAGKLTMVDHHLGKLFTKLDEHGLWERTCVILTTDHGHFLGEHGFIGKPAAPLYHTLCHLPLMIWHPEATPGRRVSALTQTVDLHATLLELLGLTRPEAPNVHSRSLLPLLLGQKETHREAAIYGYCGERVGVTSGGWTLLRDHDSSRSPLFWYSLNSDELFSRSFPMRLERPELPTSEAGRFLPGVSARVWRYPAPERAGQPARPDLLFHNDGDLEQEKNLAGARPDIVRDLERHLRAHLRRLNVPAESWLRLRL